MSISHLVILSSLALAATASAEVRPAGSNPASAAASTPASAAATVQTTVVSPGGPLHSSDVATPADKQGRDLPARYDLSLSAPVETDQPDQTCFTMRSYRFTHEQTPRAAGSSTCQTANQFRLKNAAPVLKNAAPSPVPMLRP
ncbi:MAG TPA: hypothetical protein VGD59_08155 [Acidisarcina sp.]